MLARNVDDAINSFHKELGLSLILGNSNNDGVINNTAQSENNFKNGMVVAFEIGKNEIFAVAAVPEGHSKVVSTSTTNIGYFKGTGESSSKSNKAWYYDREYLYVVVGNNSNAQWQEKNYTAFSFKDDVLSNRGTGWHETKNGFVFATVCKLTDGMGDDLSDSYIKVRNVENDINDFIELNSIDIVNESASVCGSGNEQRTGDCCLYYKDHTYDSVAGVTYAPGDYYKCTCAKCYRCLEMAEAMNMRYVFNPHVDGSVAGCTCSDGFPTNCGPCACKIEVVPGNDTILNNINLPVNGTAKQNALYGNWWKNEGKGTVFLHLTGEFSELHSSSKKINKDYHDKEKLIILKNGSQDPNKNTTKYKLKVVGKKGESYVSGIEVVEYGTYTQIPEIDITALKTIWPDADEKYFRVVMIPDLHKDIHHLLPKQLMIRKKINLSEVANLTNVSSFDSYAIGGLLDQSGAKFFSNSNKVTRNIRLTYKNNMTVDQTAAPSLSFDTFSNKQKDKKETTYKDMGGGNVSISNVTAIDATHVVAEIYAGNLDNNTKISLTFTDEVGHIFTSTDSNLPTNSQTGEILDAQSTRIYQQNSTKINIPNQSKIGNGIGDSLNVVFEVIVGTGNNQF